MKADFKKRLIAIQKELEELRQDHEVWMEEHEDPDWDCTPAGEKASEEQQSMEMAQEYLQEVTGFDVTEEY